MTKKELINLKKKMARKYYIVSTYETNGPISEYEIEQKENSSLAVAYIEKYLESLINYFSIKNQKYDEMTLALLFGVYVPEKKLDKNYEIKKDTKPLKDYVTVRVNGFYGMNRENKFEEDPDLIFDDNFREFTISFNKFKEILSSKGFDLEGIKTFDDLTNKIVNGNLSMSYIKVNFNNQKKKIKK